MSFSGSASVKQIIQLADECATLSSRSEGAKLRERIEGTLISLPDGERIVVDFTNTAELIAIVNANNPGMVLLGQSGTDYTPLERFSRCRSGIFVVWSYTGVRTYATCPCDTH